MSPAGMFILLHQMNVGRVDRDVADQFDLEFRSRRGSHVGINEGVPHYMRDGDFTGGEVQCGQIDTVRTRYEAGDLISISDSSGTVRQRGVDEAVAAGATVEVVLAEAAGEEVVARTAVD